MDVMRTLQFMKPDIKAMVWENDVNQIVYNETETFTPTAAEILAVDQAQVEAYWEQKEAADKQLSQQQILEQINILMNQLNQSKGN